MAFNFLKGRLIQSMTTLMSGTAVAQFIIIITLPIVTRLYTPEEIGIITVYISFFNFISVALALKYDSAILIAVDNKEVDVLLRLSRVFTIVTSLISVPLLLIFQRFDILGFSVLPIWAPLFGGVSLFFFGLFYISRVYHLRNSRVKLIAAATAAKSISNVTARLVSGFLGLGVLGLFIADFLGNFIAQSFFINKRKLITSPSKIEIAEYIRIIKKFKKFPLFELPSALINQLALSLPVVLIAGIYGAKAAGVFGIARMAYSLPLNQIGAAFADVFSMELGRLYRDNHNLDRSYKLFISFFSKLLLISIVILVFVLTLVPILTNIVFSSEWEMVDDIILYLSPWMLSALTIGSLSRAVIVYQRQELKFIYDIFSLFIVILTAVVAYFINLDFIQYLSFLSIGMMFSYIIYFFLIRRVIVTYDS